MTDKLHATQQSEDDDDEDLERLRLEALKTIHNKKVDVNVKQRPILQPITTTTSSSSTSQSYYQPVKLQPKSVGPQIIANSYNTVSIQPHVTGTIGAYPHNYINNATYYPSVKLPSNTEILLDVQNHNLSSYDARQRLEKLDISEPYVPQRVSSIDSNTSLGIVSKTQENWIGTESTAAAMITSTYNHYMPHKISNVQLSPRSLAFVAENNDILMRRKGESNYHRSPYSPRSSPPGSPRCASPPYRSSPGRWSRSPSPKQHSPKPRNRPQYQSQPSDFRRKSSKSPPHYRYQSKSPPPSNFRSVRRSRSRSPQTYTKNRTPPHRMSRSPNAINNRQNTRLNSRSPISNGRRKSVSPPPLRYHQNRSQANSPIHSRRSPIPRRHDSSEKTFKRRSKSPSNQLINHNSNRKSLSPRQRSRSRSPIKKYQKRSRENFTQNTRRNTPIYDRNHRRRNENVKGGGGFKNRNRKRSSSPITSFRRKRSRTKSPERVRRDDNRPRKFDRNDRRRFGDNSTRNDRRDRSLTPENKYTRINNTRKDGKVNGVDREKNKRNFEENRIETKDDKCTVEKDVKNENKSDENDVNVNNNSIKDKECVDKKESDYKVNTKIANNNDDDGDEEIRTPSRHSSYNDGNENGVEKNEKDKNFSCDEESSDSDDDDGIDLFASEESESENEGRFKLSSSKNERNTQVPTLSFSKLCETSAAPVKNLKEFDTKRDSGMENRDRNRNHSSFNDRRRDDKFKKTGFSDRRKNIERENSSRSNSRDRRGKYDFNDDDKKIEEKKPMFKSTFTAVENDVTKPNNIKFSLSKEANDRKDSKKSHDKFEKECFENDSKSTQGLTTTGKSLSSVAQITGGGKKPIHLRLGAMTNTFKPVKTSSLNRPSSPSEKV